MMTAAEGAECEEVLYSVLRTEYGKDRESGMAVRACRGVGGEAKVVD